MVDIEYCTDPNSDISGIGVRISFYLQSVLLGKLRPMRWVDCIVFTYSTPIALLSVHTKDKADISDALNTLVITNLAYCGKTFRLLGNLSAHQYHDQSPLSAWVSKHILS
jgi:hypothetical protein